MRSRLVIGLLAICVLTPALADPPNESSANTTTPASPAPATPKPASPAAVAAAPAAPAAPAAAPAAEHPTASAAQSAPITPGVEVEAAQLDQLEKHFLAEGYKIEIYNGEKYFCRRQEELGSRLGGQKRCLPAQQLMFTEKDARRQLEHAQRNQTSTP